MYNGVGVQTARGTGTSGHVSRNLGALRPVRYEVKKMKEQREKQSAAREADPGIVHHNALRQIEVQLVGLRDQLEEDGLSEEEIDAQIAIRRNELRPSIDSTSFTSVPSFSSHQDSHSLLIETRLRDERAARAFGIDTRRDVSSSSPHRLAEEAAKKMIRNHRDRSESSGRSGHHRNRSPSPRDRHGRRLRSRSRS